ncbi:type VI secretion system protein TssA [Paraburkholderia sp.]|uniref:type VI secretion system protein TssA n=1 Tax=Paraburkholderia sp. TaxID=1926495 RepID=UPI00238CEB81|nr:type VI secretion system protein TssA [Paraburkholderia sp.]MDE1180924.1 type VI secretion system protein TssA [Paraburkholderia sp.]
MNMSYLAETVADDEAAEATGANANYAALGEPFDALLAPLADHDGSGRDTGISLRDDPVFHKIREARRQDDPSLPMREWERPLVKADWKGVAALSADAIRTRSKDLQLAAWLCEAWTHERGMPGYVDGIRLLHALVERFWEHAWPQLEADDSDARAAPFVWINHTVSLVLKLHIPLLSLSVEPGSINLDGWSRIAGRSPERSGDDVVTREFLDMEVGKGTNLAELVSLERALGEALDMTAALEHSLNMRLGRDAPGFSRVMEVLMDLQRAARSLRGDRPFDVPRAESAAAQSAIADETRDAAHFDAAGTTPGNGSPAYEIAAEVVGAGHAPGPGAHPLIRDRDHAYRMLQDIAQYLSVQEPHSPTPYLLRRAVTWGELPLPELMREIMIQEGDLGRYLAMLGVT